MGYYINPPDMSKEEFLQQHGTPISPADVKNHYTGDNLPVCLVNNGAFTAAGIAFDPHEADAFLYPDGRPKRWYTVSKEVLKPYYKG